MKILLVSGYYPNDMSFGAAQRTTLMHRALQDVGEVVTLVLREGQAGVVKLAPAVGVVAEIGYPEPNLLRKYQREPMLEPLVRQVLDVDAFDLVVGRYLGPLLALPPPRGLSVVDADDAYYRYPADSGTISLAIATLKSKARTILGQRALRRVDHAWFCCKRDLDRFQLPSASVLPNVVGASPVTTESVRESDPVVLMVGALWYRPNRDAVDRFLERSWPDIRREVPEARFRAVGAAPLELRERWARSPGVECPGFVDDLAAEYRHARLSIVPVRSGGGTQIKALESLAHGRVPVVSAFVAGGFAPHLQEGESLRVADDDAGLTAAVLDLLRDPTAGEPLARRGQQIVTETFSPDRFQNEVTSTMRVLSSRRLR